MASFLLYLQKPFAHTFIYPSTFLHFILKYLLRYQIPFLYFYTDHSLREGPVKCVVLEPVVISSCHCVRAFACPC